MTGLEEDYGLQVEEEMLTRNKDSLLQYGPCRFTGYFPGRQLSSLGFPYKQLWERLDPLRNCLRVRLWSQIWFS